MPIANVGRLLQQPKILQLPKGMNTLTYLAELKSLLL